MTDKTFKKQLEQYGAEAVRLSSGPAHKKRQEEHRRVINAITKQLMSTMDGRQWLYSILDMCGVFTQPMTPGMADVTAWKCGVQAVGHKFLEDIMLAAPENYWVMIQEESARKAGKLPEDED